ncbi:GntR family transcriptional regulator [Rhodospirillaceae bacterium SYSU D60014]|uniref:GntR family transcriptional regulator n=1 Tax=Virgifigura deserti TaxID=2268457 RepID=UPI000E6617DB
MSQLASTYKRSRIPLYLQVASALRRRIEDGQWEPGQKISTLDELETEFQVARVTVRQAVDLLQKEGLVHRQQGRGTFVADRIQNKRWLKLATSWDSLISTIKDNIPKIIPVENPPPQPRLNEGDGKPAADYLFLRSVQLRQNEPFAVVNLHLARHVYERDPDAFLTHTALPILASLDDVKIAQAHQSLVIGSADTETAHLLKVALNSPTAECHCVVVDAEGTAIYVAEIIYPGDCVKLYIDLLENGRASRSRKSRS